MVEAKSGQCKIKHPQRQDVVEIRCIPTYKALDFQVFPDSFINMAIKG